MMETVEISEDNLESFLSLLGEDLSEDISRLYYRGIGVTDGKDGALGAMVCELVNADRDEDRRSRIRFLCSGSKEGFEAIHRHYRDQVVAGEGVTESAYELAEEAEAKALEEEGFSLEKRESDTILLPLEKLADSRLAKGKIPAHISSIEGLSILQFRNAVKQILFKGHPGILEDIPYLSMNWFDSKVSSCVISGDLVPGLFLIRRNPSGTLIPVLYCAYGADCKKNLLHMLRRTVQNALQLYPPDTPVMIVRQNPSIRALTDKLLPDQKGAEVFLGTRKEEG